MQDRKRHEPAPRRGPRAAPLLWAFGMAAAIFAAYLPALRAGAIWDDDDYLTQNSAVQSPGGLLDLWSIRYDPQERRYAAATPQYYPLVFTTFWVEYRLWGLNLSGYHAVNVLLHIANSLLVWRIAARLRVPLPWLLGAVFGLHPMHVETTAWITERKNVLSGLFYLLAMRSYLKFAAVREAGNARALAEGGAFRVPRPTRPPDATAMQGADAAEAKADAARRGRGATVALVASLMFFICGVLSKTVTCTLPAALFLIEWWRAGRLTGSEGARVWRALVRLTPYFVVGLPLAFMTVYLEQTQVGATGSEWALPVAARVAILAPATFLHYATKLLWPHPLIFVYPRWEIAATDAAWYIPLAVVAAALIAAGVVIRRVGPGPLIAVLLSAASLAPALGFFNVYPFRFSYVADHFCYLGSLGFLALYVAFGRRLMRLIAARHRSPSRENASARHPSPPRGRGHGEGAGRGAGSAPIAQDAIPPYGRPVAVGLLVLLAIATFRETLKYANAATLWERTLAQNPRAWSAMNNLGNEYAARDRLDEAIGLFRRAAEYPAARVDAYGSWANLLMFKLGRFDDAADKYRLCLAEDRNQWRTYANLSLAYKRAGRDGDALATVRDGLTRDWRRPVLWYNYALFLADIRDYESAALAAEEAIRLDPKLTPLQALRGEMLLRLGRYPEAVEPLRRAAAEIPDPSVTLYLSQALAGAGRYAEALAAARGGMSRFRDSPAMMLETAWLLATSPEKDAPNPPGGSGGRDSAADAGSAGANRLRNGAEAVRLANRAIQLLGGGPQTWDVLAAALAESGDFAKAAEIAEKAAASARSAGDAAAADTISQRLVEYRASRPWRATTESTTQPAKGP